MHQKYISPIFVNNLVTCPSFPHPLRHPWYLIPRELLFDSDIMVELELFHRLILVVNQIVKQRVRLELLRILRERGVCYI